MTTAGEAPEDVVGGGASSRRRWVIVTGYVPALLVSSALILWQLVRAQVAVPMEAPQAG